MMNRTAYGQRIVLAATAVLLLLVVAGVSGVRTLVRYERQRDLDTWQVTLGVMADYRAQRVLQWASGQFTFLEELAGNGSLQIYTQQLQREVSAEGASEPAQLSYLRNLILDTAERHSLMEKAGAKQLIPANVAHVADVGLALMNKDMTPIVTTPGMPVLNKELRQAGFAVMESGLPRIRDIFLDDQARPLVSFLVPVFALQKAEAGKEVVGVLLAIKNASTELFPLLESEGAVTTSDEAMLVRQDQESVLYVSPLADGSTSLAKRQPVETRNLDAAHALVHPGSFVEKRDYAGVEVLSTSRILPGLPWLLVQKISSEEALKESASHQQLMYSVSSLLLGLVLALMLAAWFYGSKVKEQVVTGQLEEKAGQLAAQALLLSAISDNIGDYLFLAKPNGELIFVNQACAIALGLDDANDARGKTLVSTLGVEPGKQFMALIENGMKQNQPLTQEMVVEVNGRSLLLHVSCIAFPYTSTGERDGVLLSLHDLTELDEVRQKKELLLIQIVKALVRAIDLHDPHSANHSANTTTIAMAIGKRLGFDCVALNALETASSLCNIGKLFISKEVLAKTGPLTATEQAELRKEPEFAQKILAGIDFSGPVLEAIIQKNELLDGSGHPKGLQGEAIIPMARVLAAANAFVAMVSPRAYRDRLPVKEAIAQILAAGDTKYDRQVVAALFQVTENEIDWEKWPSAGE
ncbi:MAG: PAS domain S-box protein [Desulfobulbaceae bacterium]|nr:PAS domain S-box protein [Desulfobulbaceae bacterium]